MADTGNGATITFSTYAGSLKIIEMDLGERGIEDLDVSTLATIGDMEVIPSDLRSTNEVRLVVQWDTGETPPVPGGAAETVTITFPLRTGEGTAANLAGTAYFKTVKFPVLANGTVQQGEITIKYDGATGPTYTASVAA